MNSEAIANVGSFGAQNIKSREVSCTLLSEDS
jgi:hypothetical protein